MDCRVKTTDDEGRECMLPFVSILDLMDCRVKTEKGNIDVLVYGPFQSLI